MKPSDFAELRESIIKARDLGLDQYEIGSLLKEKLPTTIVGNVSQVDAQELIDAVRETFDNTLRSQFRLLQCVDAVIDIVHGLEQSARENGLFDDEF
jgi:hypothetical protein